MNLVKLLQEVVERQPDKVAFYEGGQALCYRDFYRQTQHIAQGLRALGVVEGDRLLVLMPLSVSLYATLCAAWTLGAGVVIFDPSAGREHVRRCLTELPIKLFVGNRKSLLLRWLVGPLRRIPQHCNVDTLSKGEADVTVPPVEVGEEAPALITFTSGSTATPKAIVRTHGFLLRQHAALVASLPYQEDDVDLATLPVFTLINLVEGITTVLPADKLSNIARVDAAKLVAQVQERGVNRITASPALLDQLCVYAQKEGLLLDSLRSVHVGGGPVFLDILERMSSQMNPQAIELVYGSTEAEPIATVAWTAVTKQQKQAMKTGAGLLAGQPVEALKVAVIENRAGMAIPSLTVEEFAALRRPCGQAGEIVVAGAHVVQGYLRPEQDQDNKIRVAGEIWHRTGDCGRFDAEGYLWLLGRAGQVLRQGAAEIYPFAVESAIRAAYGCRAAVCADAQGQMVLVLEESSTLPQVEQQYAAQFTRIVTLKRIPLDSRHASKVDYPALRRLL